MDTYSCPVCGGDQFTLTFGGAVRPSTVRCDRCAYTVDTYRPPQLRHTDKPAATRSSCPPRRTGANRHAG